MTRRRLFFTRLRTAWLQCTALGLLWFFAHGAHAANAIAILTDGQRLMLSGQMDFLTDGPAIRPEKLLAGAYENEFRRYDDTAVNFQSGPVWLRIRIANNTSKNAVVLSLNDALYTEADVLYNRAGEGQHVDVIRLAGGILQDGMTEDDMPQDQRWQDESHQRWPYYDIGFRLDIPHDQARTIYLRLHTPYLLLLNPYLTDEQTYSQIQVQQIAWGYWMAGIMAGVLVYLMMIALSVQGVPEVRYCASFVAVSLLILLYGRGYLFQYLSGAN
ncbi:MAG TPA: 7TM-DISM domain-containing protein, partial [Pseudomonadales bacterium]|nr:7TM-DISM domain-containing protein [Pseudomonadales bacterium]